MTITTIVAIAHIITLNPPNVFVIATLAFAQALPSVTDFLRGIWDNQIARREQELDIQIRKDRHELEMKAAREQLSLPSRSNSDSTQKPKRLEDKENDA